MIIILDFGSVYTHLLAKRMDEFGVYSKMYLPTAETKQLKTASGLILSGGPNKVFDQSASPYNREIFDLGIPVLGICYGHQLMAQHFGGRVESGSVEHLGFFKIKWLGDTELNAGMAPEGPVWMRHEDMATQLPPGFDRLAQTKHCAIAAIVNSKKKLYGIQFHPEATRTVQGRKILRNFVFDIC
jgi:GMP synthase (glutamine-hydrolysing)